MIDDISEALRESEQRYRTLFEQAPIGVYVYDRSLRILECNARFCAILHSTFDKLIGLDMRSLRDQRVVPAIEHALTGEPSYYAGQYQSTTSGARVWVSMRMSPLRDRGGAVVGGMGLVEDITEQRLAEEALRQSEVRFRSVVELSPDLVTVIRHGQILYVNPAFGKRLGYDAPSQMVGRPVSDFIVADQHAVVAERIDRVMNVEAMPPQEYRLIRQDGGLVEVEFRSIRIDYDGAPALLAIGRDVTERKLIQARLLQTDRMASVGTLAAGVAHEINNPLAYVMANLDMVAQRSMPSLLQRLRALEEEVARLRGDPEPRREASLQAAKVAQMIDVAREGAERVRHTVGDLKTFSRPDEEKRALVDVRRVLDASIAIAWNEIRHRAQLVREYDEVPPVLANEARLGQLFLNLIVNAAQAMPVGNAAEHRLRLRTLTEGGRVVVEVRDTGHGIPKEHLARLFDPFFTTKPVGVGTGLGLWICQGIVASLEGTITARSDPGDETTFRVELPPARRTSAAATGEAGRREEGTMAGDRGRVLLVDDEAALANVLASALSTEHEVVVTTSGREALDLLRRDPKFDVILCDLMMPDVSGMDLYERLRDTSPATAAKLIFVTGGAFTPRAREFLDAVKNERVEKPFDLDALRALLRARMRPSAG